MTLCGRLLIPGAPFIKSKTGAKVGIGEQIRAVQKIFRPVFNATDLKGDGSEFDHLFKDGELFQIGTLDVEVIHGAEPAFVTWPIGGTTVERPDGQPASMP
jgi:hypothetical protein